MRIEWLDSLKGFAIFLVVVGHVILGYIRAETFTDYQWSLQFVSKPLLLLQNLLGSILSVFLILQLCFPNSTASFDKVPLHLYNSIVSKSCQVSFTKKSDVQDKKRQRINSLPLLLMRK